MEFEAIAVKLNSEGFNDREHSVDKPKGVFRIVVLGDSFVEALQVDQSKNFHKVLERLLNAGSANAYEVVAFGRSNFGAKDYYEILRDKAIQYRPNLVIVALDPANDFRNDSTTLTAYHREQLRLLRNISKRVYLPELYEPDSTWPAFIRNSRFVSFVAQRSLNLWFKIQISRLPLHESVPVDYFVHKAVYEPSDPFEAAWKVAWDSTLEYVKKARGIARSNGAEFLVVGINNPISEGGARRTYPWMNRVDWDWSKPEIVLAEFFSENDIEFLDLEPLFRDVQGATAKRLHFEYDGHWNEAGHEFAADMIYKRLVTGRGSRPLAAPRER
jgi:hypothetical protein